VPGGIVGHYACHHRGIQRFRRPLYKSRVADFTVLIEGGSGPQPHASFIEVFGEAAVDHRDWTMEGAGDKQET
jgi:hypothetical protein